MSPSRTSWLTRALFQIHLWCGLALGVYAIVIGVSGSVLVFHEEIVEFVSPHQPIPAGQPVAIETVYSAIRSAYPDLSAGSLEAPWEADDPWLSYVFGPSGGKMVRAGQDGRVLGDAPTGGLALEAIAKIHSYLLLPRGRLINGAGGLGLVLLALTGLVLWWPARGEWHEAFRIVRRSSWKGLVFDLHRVGGVVSLVFVLVFSVTGAYFTWPAAYRTIAAGVLPTKTPMRVPEIEAAGDRRPLDELVQAAHRAVPDAKLVRVLVPDRADQPVTVVLAHGDSALDRRLRTSQVILHPATATVLALDSYRRRQAGDHLIGWMSPLHTGHFGGLAVKILWAVAGLSLPALFVTGFLMWKHRVIDPLRRRHARG
jgi:uncharacterized iron-regulated membrane protein